MFTFLENWREKRAIRKTHQRLHQLSDKILWDIGLTRSDIASVGRDGHLMNRFEP